MSKGTSRIVPGILLTIGLAGLLWYSAHLGGPRYFSQPTYVDITAVGQSNDGKRLAVGLMAHTGALFGFGPRGRASQLNYVRIVDIDGLRIVPRPLAHKNSVIWDVAFAPDDSVLVSAAEDPVESVNFWNATSGESLASLSMWPDKACGVAVSPNGLWVAIAPCEATMIGILDAKTHRQQQTLPVTGSFSNDLNLVFLADSRHLLAKQKHLGAVILDIDDPSDVFHIECKDSTHGTDYVISPNKKYLAISCMAPDVNSTQLWNLEERRMLASLPLCFTQALADHSIALGHHDRIDILSVPAAEVIHTIPSYGPGMTFLGIAFSPDERLLATAGGHNNTVRMWDLQRGRQLWEYNQGDPDFGWVTFNKAGTRLVATLGRAILPTQVNANAYLKVLDVGTGREIFSVTHDPREEIEETH